jgi:hypothetical protein
MKYYKKTIFFTTLISLGLFLLVSQTSSESYMNYQNEFFIITDQGEELVEAIENYR